MSMLMTGGAVGPDDILFTRAAMPPEATTELVAAAPIVVDVAREMEDEYEQTERRVMDSDEPLAEVETL